ncbi:MAG: hydroxymethylglutaryl-CoA synthase [Candidatus Syntropharchaeia archaeon]
MVGIVSYGAYIPRYRLNRKTIFSAMGWLGASGFAKGEKAVANYDEDSITMAVAASVDCLNGMDRSEIDGLYFATTTPPYKERVNSGIIATALDLDPETRTADFTDSTKAGITALLAAWDAVRAGSAKNVIVCAADCRLGKAGSAQEMTYGDGAAAFIVGKDGLIADLQDFYSLTYDIPDHWRTDMEKFDRAWEDRFIRDVGYTRMIPDAISGLMKKCNLEPKDISKVLYPGLYPRDYARIGKKLGFEPEQIHPHLFESVGYAGTADPLMILVSALENGKPGEKIIAASYGNGSDAILLETTEKLEEIKGKRRGIKGYLDRRKELDNYEKYISFRNILPIEKGIRGEDTGFTQLSMIYRRRRELFGLVGTKCKRCGTPQYPPQRVCVNPDCRAVDEMEDYRFSDKKGTLFAYTEDHLAFSINPPAIYGILDFDGGGRYWMDLTDCESGTVKVGDRVEMSFRKKYTDEKWGVHSYFWKAVPIKE